MAKVESSSLLATAIPMSTLSIWPLAHLPSELNQPSRQTGQNSKVWTMYGWATIRPEMQFR
jgi:hypothetical protein